MSSLPMGQPPTAGAGAGSTQLADAREGRRRQAPESETQGPSTWAWEHGWPETAEAFGLLIETFQDRLVRYAWRRLGNLADAEDAVQEVFVRAFADRSKRQKVSRVGPYLYRMVANACTDAQRKRRRAAISLEEAGAERIPAGGKSPAEKAEAAEEALRVEEMLRKLPRAQAEAIRLRVFEGLRLNEIAEAAGCSTDTVSSRLRYGFRKLRRIVSGKKG